MKNLNKLKQTVKARLAPHRITQADHTNKELFEMLYCLYGEMEKEGYTTQEISLAVQEEMYSQMKSTIKKYKEIKNEN